MSKLVTVTIRECTANGREFVSRHRDENPANLQALGAPVASGEGWGAVEKAIQQRWGKSAGFHVDSGISVGRGPHDGTQYGQVGVPCKGGGTNLITGRISVSID